MHLREHSPRQAPQSPSHTLSLVTRFSVWLHVSAEKEGIIVETTPDYVGVVYDRVDDPHGRIEQYGIQRLPWPEFWRTHWLKHELASAVRR